jgi:hypothetical protein
MRKIHVGRYGRLKVRVALPAAIAAGLIGGVTTPASGSLLDSGSGGGSVAEVRIVNCSWVPAQIRGLEKNSCR